MSRAPRCDRHPSSHQLELTRTQRQTAMANPRDSCLDIQPKPSVIKFVEFCMDRSNQGSGGTECMLHRMSIVMFALMHDRHWTAESIFLDPLEHGPNLAWNTIRERSIRTPSSVHEIHQRLGHARPWGLAWTMSHLRTKAQESTKGSY